MLLTNHKFVCPVRHISNKTLEFETDLLQIHTRRWVVHALRTPKLLKAFSKLL